MQNIFTCTCSCAIVCVLHVGLAALTRETILNHVHVSHVAHTQGVYLTHELYCNSSVYHCTQLHIYMFNYYTAQLQTFMHI